MENKIMYVHGAKVEICYDYAVKTQEEKQAIVDRVSRIIMEAEKKKLRAEKVL